MRLRTKLVCVLATIGLIAAAGPAFAQDDSAEESSEASGSSATADGKLKIKDAKAASDGVEDREPQGVTSSFSKGDQVTVWMAVQNPEKKQTLELVWKRDGAKAGSVDLDVGKSWKWRTWGRITVNNPGDWTAEIKGPDGETLETVEFSVSE